VKETEKRVSKSYAISFVFLSTFSTVTVEVSWKKSLTMCWRAWSYLNVARETWISFYVNASAFLFHVSWRNLFILLKYHNRMSHTGFKMNWKRLFTSLYFTPSCVDGLAWEIPQISADESWKWSFVNMMFFLRQTWDIEIEVAIEFWYSSLHFKRLDHRPS
jgi:hypothetical protein